MKLRTVRNVLIGALVVLSGSAVAEEFVGDTLGKQIAGGQLRLASNVPKGTWNKYKPRDTWNYQDNAKQQYVYLPHPLKWKKEVMYRYIPEAQKHVSTKVVR